MTDMPLFPVEDVQEPPRTCPKCGGHVLRPTFTFAECVSCGWEWRREAQIASDEAWPKDVL